MMAKKANPVPTYDRMMWPGLKALMEMGGSATNQEHLDRVVQLMNIPEVVQALPHKDGPMTAVGYRLAWARTYLKKAGAVENSERGVWSITPLGKKLTEAEVAKIPKRVRRGEFDLEADQQHEEQEDWRAELLSVVKKMPADGFERLAQRILREEGFVKVEVTGRSGDGGIDGIGVLKVGLVSFHVLFQCKRYKDAVGPSAIRDFRGAMQGRTDKGLFITSGRFTPEATREASRDGAPPVELIDGEQLCDLLKKLKLGLQVEMVEEVSVVPGFFEDI